MHVDLILATIGKILWGDHGVGFWPILVLAGLALLLDKKSKIG